MKKYLVSSTIVAIIVVMALSMLTVGLVSGKAHVPAGQVQISHKGMAAKSYPAAALGGHLRHGDIQLPACDFANVFGDGADTSDVVSTSFAGVMYADGSFVERVDAGGATPACPPGTF